MRAANTFLSLWDGVPSEYPCATNLYRHLVIDNFNYVHLYHRHINNNRD